MNPTFSKYNFDASEGKQAICLKDSGDAMNGEEFCEGSNMIQNEEGCKASSCCHWNTWEEGEASFNGQGRCWSSIGSETCHDMGGQTADNVVEEKAQGVGGWGGSCTCPDGSVYQVGDNFDYCDSLACHGGISGTCNRVHGEWSYRKVTCAARQ